MENKVLAGVRFWTEIHANEKKLDVEFSLPDDKEVSSSDEENSEDGILENVFKQFVPSMALKQIAEMSLLLLVVRQSLKA